MGVLTSKLIVALVDQVSAPSRALAAAMGRLNQAQLRNNQRLDAMRGRMLEAGAVAYGLARAVGAPVNAATEFETTLEDIGQKLDVPVDGLQSLGREIRAVARDTTQSAQAMAGGMDTLAGMGANRADALGLLKPIGRAATAYRAEIADLAKAGYAALDNLKVPADQFGRALDSMAQAGKAGAFELRDMAQYFPSLGAAYQGLNQKGVPAVADLASALQIVRKGAGDSAEAATNLGNVLQKINSPATRKAFKKLGIDLEKEMAKAAKAGQTPIEAIAEITNRALKGNLGRLGDLFEDAQVQKGLRPLIQNMEEYRKIRKEALAAQGVVEADYARRLQTGAMATQRWKIALEGLNLAVGTALLPALTSLANGLVPIVNRIGALAERYPVVTRAVVATTAALVGLRVAALAAQFAFLWLKGGVITAAIGRLSMLRAAGALAAVGLLPVVGAFRALRASVMAFAVASAFGGFSATFAAMGASLLGLLNPIRLVRAAFLGLRVAMVWADMGAAILAIAAAGLAIYNNWNGIVILFQSFGAAFMAAMQPVAPVLQPVIAAVSRLWDVLKSLVGEVDASGQSWAAAGAAAGRYVGEIVVKIVELPARIRALVGEMVAAGQALMQGLLDGLKAGAAAVVDYVAGVGARIKDAISDAAANAWSSVKSKVSGSPAVAGARAAGGPVRGGSTYLVGERGPELVTFGRSGLVHDALRSSRALRAAALGAAVAGPAAAAPAPAVTNVGGVAIHVHAAPGQSAEAVAQAVERKLSAKLASLSRGAFSDGVT